MLIFKFLVIFGGMVLKLDTIGLIFSSSIYVYSCLIGRVKTNERKLTVSSTPKYIETPNKNIVQNHLNMALLNLFLYLNGRYRNIFIP